MNDLKFYIGDFNNRHFEAQVKNLIIDLANKNVILVTECYEVTEQDGPRIVNEFTSSYGRNLIANNSTLVHPTTGAYWNETPEKDKEGIEPIGEWDFFWFVANNVQITVVPFILQTLNKNRQRLLPS